MDIKAFKAYRFNADVVGNPGDCVAPPYDVIDAPFQDELYGRNDYNIVRAIKGKSAATDNEGDNVYTRAAAYIEQAIADGALVQESDNAIYVYVQDFEI
ncbi:MAG: DUF1015 family protein, partial [Planctomycetota bacterium]